MAKLEWKGKTIEELKAMTLEEFAKIASARARRNIKRGLSEQHKNLLKNVRAWKPDGKPIRTHLRNMFIFPEMVDVRLAVYNGKTFVPVTPTIEMIGRYIGEFSQTRQKVTHSSPGFGATRSSKYVPLK
ncbi:MAG: 30S ribosomal protein S19 [Candidatus Aenigmatarchaeota archaeon]